MQIYNVFYLKCFLTLVIIAKVTPMIGIASSKSIPYKRKSVTGCTPNKPKLPSKKHSAAEIVCGICRYKTKALKAKDSVKCLSYQFKNRIIGIKTFGKLYY